MGADYYAGDRDSAAARCAAMLERYAKAHGIDLTPRPELARRINRVSRQTQATAQAHEASDQIRAPRLGCDVETALAGIRHNLRKIGMTGPYVVVATPIQTPATWHVAICGTSRSGNPSMRRLSTYQTTEDDARKVVAAIAAELTGG